MSDNEIRSLIAEAIKENDTILFMKGSPDAPACGFSARTVAMLQQLETPFAAVDILPDPRIRQELSAISKWPTIPQLFHKGELVEHADGLRGEAAARRVRRPLHEEDRLVLGDGLLDGGADLVVAHVGTSVFRERAWMRSPSSPAKIWLTSWCCWMRLSPANAGETISARKWWPSPVTSACASGSPASMRSRISSVETIRSEGSERYPF